MSVRGYAGHSIPPLWFRQEVCREMEAVLTYEVPTSRRQSPAGLLGILRRICPVFMAKEAETQPPLSRAAVNQRAECLLRDHGDSILRLAYSYLHNRSDAEEIVQDTLMQFVKTVPSLESAQHERAWLLRVARNLSLNRVKYNALRATDELKDELAAEERTDLSFVWDAVKALPVPYREVIHLFHYEGYSTAQIAQMLGRKESTVRSDLRRGRGKLKEILKEEYDFEEV